MATQTESNIVKDILSGGLLNLPDLPWIEERIPLDLLKVDMRYQRELKQSFVNEILEAGFDERAAGHLIVSLRDDGDFYVINGQHRAEAARRSGYDSLMAQIVELKDWHEEAELRLKTNRSKQDNSREKFKTRLAKGDPVAKAIDVTLRKYGTYINSPGVRPAVAVAGRRRGSPGDGIDCVQIVEAIYKKGLLEEVCDFIVKSYDDFSGRSGAASILRATSWLVEKHRIDPNFDINKMTLRLRTVGTEDLHMRAVKHRAIAGGSHWKNHYRAMLEIYNEAIRGEDKKLHPIEH